MKIAAVIPVHGRLQIIGRTIGRLARQKFDGGPVRVVVVGDTAHEEAAAREAGAHFYRYKNQPLGEKWQYGIDMARADFDPDAILIIGSTDWVSDDWCACMAREIEAGADMAGKRGLYFLDIQSRRAKRMIWWGGYGRGDRQDEPIGAGRLISRRVLDLTGWRMFSPIPKSLDWSCIQKVRRVGGRVVCADSLPCQALSISCFYWSNLHQFDREASSPTARAIASPDTILDCLFPDWPGLMQ